MDVSSKFDTWSRQLSEAFKSGGTISLADLLCFLSLVDHYIYTCWPSFICFH
jgi:hypothetical protein